MMRCLAFRTLLTSALLTLVATGCYAAKLNTGDAAPNFASLPGTDDKSHSLADYKDAKAIVVVFTCNHCPVARAYQDRLIAIQNDYKDKGVQVIAVNVNKGEADALDAMKTRAEEAKFNFPYLFDASQKSAVEYGATCTPHVFVLDKDRKIAYQGAIDDNMHADKAEKPYLRNALDALVDGKAPATAMTKQFGCGIRFE